MFRNGNLDCLQRSGELTDVTILVEGSTFPAHRVILAAHSDYFHRSSPRLNQSHWGVPCIYLYISWDWVGGDIYIQYHTVYPRSLDQFYMVSYYIKWVKTSWTFSILPTARFL